MSRFEVWFSTWIVHHRWWFLLAIPLLVVAAASGARHLEFTNDYRVFFSKENPQLQAFETLENTYNKQDNILIMLAPGNREVFTRKTLAAVRELTEAAWQIPHSLRVDSIANFQHTYADGDELVVEDLVYSADSLSDDDLLAIRLTALHEPLLVNRLVSADGSVTAVNITIELPGIDEHVEGPQAVAHARELVQRLESEYPDIRFFSTGMVIMNNTFAEQSRADMASLVPISFAAMLLVLGFMLRSLSGMLATVLVILMSIATGLGLGAISDSRSRHPRRPPHHHPDHGHRQLRAHSGELLPQFAPGTGPAKSHERESAHQSATGVPDQPDYHRRLPEHEFLRCAAVSTSR